MPKAKRRKTMAEKAADAIGLYRESLDMLRYLEADSPAWLRALEVNEKCSRRLFRLIMRHEPTKDDLSMEGCCVFPDDRAYVFNNDEKAIRDYAGDL